MQAIDNDSSVLSVVPQPFLEGQGPKNLEVERVDPRTPIKRKWGADEDLSSVTVPEKLSVKKSKASLRTHDQHEVPALPSNNTPKSIQEILSPYTSKFRAQPLIRGPRTPRKPTNGNEGPSPRKVSRSTSTSVLSPTKASRKNARKASASTSRTPRKPSISSWKSTPNTATSLTQLRKSSTPILFSTEPLSQFHFQQPITLDENSPVKTCLLTSRSTRRPSRAGIDESREAQVSEHPLQFTHFGTDITATERSRIVVLNGMECFKSELRGEQPGVRVIGMEAHGRATKERCGGIWGEVDLSEGLPSAMVSAFDSDPPLFLNPKPISTIEFYPPVTHTSRSISLDINSASQFSDCGESVPEQLSAAPWMWMSIDIPQQPPLLQYQINPPTPPPTAHGRFGDYSSSSLRFSSNQCLHPKSGPGPAPIIYSPHSPIETINPTIRPTATHLPPPLYPRIYPSESNMNSCQSLPNSTITVPGLPPPIPFASRPRRNPSIANFKPNLHQNDSGISSAMMKGDMSRQSPFLEAPFTNSFPTNDSTYPYCPASLTQSSNTWSFHQNWVPALFPETDMLQEESQHVQKLPTASGYTT